MDIPDYVEPYNYESPTDTWSVGDTGTVVIDTAEADEIVFKIRQSGNNPSILARQLPTQSDGTVDLRALWTAVHWLREFGFPGVSHETIRTPKRRLSVGGLYCIAVAHSAFDFLPRETDYERWGEYPIEDSTELERT